MLNIYPPTIEIFGKEDIVYVCEPPWGVFYDLEEDIFSVIKRFEEEYDVLVYMVVRSFSKKFGKLDALLYVSDNQKEWETDRLDLQANTTMAYVHNEKVPRYSEFGYIGFELSEGAGLLRTW